MLTITAMMITSASELRWTHGAAVPQGTRAYIYDGTPYRDGWVRMNNMINYPDGRVEFVR